ncbi:hypothetical protein Tco_0789640 [Tanacetum coccineum]
MSTPIDFLAFAMNHLKINKLTKADLVGSVYNLLKGTCKIYVKLAYNMEECYRALSEQLNWNNPEGNQCPCHLSKPLPMQESQGRLIVPANFFFNNDLEYLRGRSIDKKYTASTTKTKATRYETVGIEDMVPTLWSPIKEIVLRRADQNLYTFMKGDFLRLHLNNIEDMLLLVVQNNLDDNVIVQLAVGLCIFTQRIVIQERVEDIQLGSTIYHTIRPSRSNYEDKLKRKRFMRTDELYKFSDGTLTSVRNTLHQMLTNLEIGYNKAMRQRLWTTTDQKRIRIMIKYINQMLLERRIMRSLEKFVGVRDYGTNYRLLQRTV